MPRKQASNPTLALAPIKQDWRNMSRFLIIDARADVDVKDAKTDRSLFDLQQHDARALSSEKILALVHER